MFTIPEWTAQRAWTLLIALAAAGCQQNAPMITGSAPTDYRDRHPISIVEGPASIDLLIGSGRGGLTAAQRAQVAAFGGSWRQKGNGMLIVNVPKGTPNEPAARATVREIASILQHAGVPPKAISVQPYHPKSPIEAGPIRLAYPTMRAEVGPCGNWPRDVGPTSDALYWHNEPYFNLGCATQRNLAAAVVDPHDLLQPRAETPPSAARRATVLDKYRQGLDTTTAVSTTGAGRISQVGQQ
jgi:pilus assembly protein CpaD